MQSIEGGKWKNVFTDKSIKDKDVNKTIIISKASVTAWG